jgi:hypothetical protein
MDHILLDLDRSQDKRELSQEKVGEGGETVASVEPWTAPQLRKRGIVLF